MGMPELVAPDILIKAIRSRTHKIMVARINPQDMAKTDMVSLRVVLGCNEILPSSEVERGWLYLNIKPLR